MKWGILSTGTIAKNFAQTAKQMPDVQVQAVASRSAGSAKAFAEAFAIPTAHDSYEALANDPNVDIVYVATPHSRHAEDMKLLIQAGKHVLCEKSFTIDAKQAKEIFALAQEKHVFVMEAFWTKFIPLYRQIEEILESGKLGEIRAVTAQYGYTTARETRKFDPALAGGTLLDIGVYALSVVRSFMDEQPNQIISQWKPSPTGSDEQAAILLQNPSGQMATVALSMHSKQPKRAMISCETGYLEIMEFPRADRAVFVDAETGKRTEITCGESRQALYYEMTDMEDAVQNADASAMQLPYSKDVMDIMTKLRKDWKLQYPKEQW